MTYWTWLLPKIWVLVGTNVMIKLCFLPEAFSSCTSAVGLLLISMCCCYIFHDSLGVAVFSMDPCVRFTWLWKIRFLKLLSIRPFACHWLSDSWTLPFTVPFFFSNCQEKSCCCYCGKGPTTPPGNLEGRGLEANCIVSFRRVKIWFQAWSWYERPSLIFSSEKQSI